ncbi:hypothetical protein VM1G_11836 [Cytospora mali]|uniref:Uncharacterized protein n=1 Tax=Cytospora mali TaxID=578113 RepID=A0A194W5Z8_CYTMA|nr:hypothetical protein VM1G_11836 [Valsa mali]
MSSPGDIRVVFEYQQQFAVASADGSPEPWYSLFPRGGGFIQHPEISPEPKCLSVYHQLHCLDTIRNGYWSAYDCKDPEHHMSSAHG